MPTAPDAGDRHASPASPASLFDELLAFPTPPLAEWTPSHIADIDLRIAADGQWFYRGSAIARQRMVKLFASVLRLEADGYFLITPQVKYPVTVDDAPFLAVELQRRGEGRAQTLHFRTNVDDVITAGRAHPITVTTDPHTAQPSPVIEVRDNLTAKITRAVFYELAEMLEPVGETVGVYSDGEFFVFGDLENAKQQQQP